MLSNLLLRNQFLKLALKSLFKNLYLKNLLRKREKRVIKVKSMRKMLMLRSNLQRENLKRISMLKKVFHQTKNLLLKIFLKRHLEQNLHKEKPLNKSMIRMVNKVQFKASVNYLLNQPLSLKERPLNNPEIRMCNKRVKTNHLKKKR